MPADPRRHLSAALLATGLALALAVTVSMVSRRLERRWIFTLAPFYVPAKNQGVALVRAAFDKPNMLPIYAGSELQRESVDKAPIFFHDAPTGFNVCAVGREGSMPLNLLHRVAAVRSAVHDKKLIVMLSPTWFFMSAERPRYYEGNFSAMQAEEFAFDSGFDFALRRDVAREMLEFPSTITHHPLLAFALHRLAGDTAWDRTLLFASLPLAWLERAILHLQDHVLSLGAIRKLARTVTPENPKPQILDWPQLLADADRAVTVSADASVKSEHTYSELEHGQDPAFRELVAGAEEWRRFELLLRALGQIPGKVLLLSPPLNGPYLDRLGVSLEARSEFYGKMRASAARYGLRLVDFQNHESDATFLLDRHDHPSVKGWMYYNQTIDRFFHGRL